MLAILWKDILLELRTKERVSSLLVLAILIVFVFVFAVPRFRIHQIEYVDVIQYEFN